MKGHMQEMVGENWQSLSMLHWVIHLICGSISSFQVDGQTENKMQTLPAPLMQIYGPLIFAHILRFKLFNERRLHFFFICLSKKYNTSGRYIPALQRWCGLSFCYGQLVIKNPVLPQMQSHATISPTSTLPATRWREWTHWRTAYFSSTW